MAGDDHEVPPVGRSFVSPDLPTPPFRPSSQFVTRKEAQTLVVIGGIAPSAPANPVMVTWAGLAGLEAANRDGDAEVARIVERGLDPEHLGLLALLLGHTIIAGRLGGTCIERGVEEKFKSDQLLMLSLAGKDPLLAKEHRRSAVGVGVDVPTAGSVMVSVLTEGLPSTAPPWACPG